MREKVIYYVLIVVYSIAVFVACDQEKKLRNIDLIGIILCFIPILNVLNYIYIKKALKNIHI